MAGDMLHYPFIIIVAVGSGFIIAVIIFYVQWNGKRARNLIEKSDGKLYDDFSKCSSPGCVRCHNYEELSANLRERFLKYKEEICKGDDNVHHKEMDLKRLQFSIENSLEVDGDDPKPESAVLQKPNVFTLEGLDASPWPDGTFSSEISVLENAFPTIKQEYKELLIEQNISENFQGWIENDVPDGMWSVFHLFNQGCKIEENCSRCPKTVAILESIGVFMTGCAFGNATFSVLEAGTHITEHYGPCNLRIRCHLGLHIPSDCCTLTVAHRSRRWSEGKCLLFDDSFLHEARHAGSENRGPRVVLMVDFWHPHITATEKRALRHLLHL